MWFTSQANELGRLAQGIRDIKGTDTPFFVLNRYHKIEDITYGHIIVEYRPGKEEKNRSRLAVVGGRIDCMFGVSTPTCNLPTTKLMWNLVISTSGLKYFTVNISIFFI